MRKLLCFLFVALLATTVVSCASNKPAINMDSMTVEEHAISGNVMKLWESCGNYYVFGNEPGTQTFDCEVPFISEAEIAFGWNAKDTTVLDTNLNAMTWELYIDEYRISLDEFEPAHTGGKDVAGNPVKAQVWTIDLVNISPGKHTFRLLWKSEVPIDDGFNVHAPGTYENIVNFTVLEK